MSGLGIYVFGIANAALSQLSYIPNVDNNGIFVEFHANLRI
jgi:hypothetical protein